MINLEDRLVQETVRYVEDRSPFYRAKFREAKVTLVLIRHLSGFSLRWD